MERQRAERARQEIIRLCHAGLDSRTLRIEVIKRLRTVIPIEVSFFTTADPGPVHFGDEIRRDGRHRTAAHGPEFLRTRAC